MNNIDNQNNLNTVLNTCPTCGKQVANNYKFCTNCGTPLYGSNSNLQQPTQQQFQATTNQQVNNQLVQQPVQEKYITINDFDPMYALSENAFVETYIYKELQKANIPLKDNLLPKDELVRKKRLNIIFSILLFVFMCLIFFHFPIQTYGIGILILFIFFMVLRKYNIVKYITKQAKSRPSEKISNIVMSVKPTLQEYNNKIYTLMYLVALILPLLIFYKPRIFYEKMDNGYGVRFYTFGVTNFTTATIPEKYKGEDVISLRGNTFSNMRFLKKVQLPDTITEIRGQAFKNNFALSEVNIPKNLEYLGGGAFYNCRSITHIELPDTVTYLGGEAFYNASSLESIVLSKNITEIRGNTFEECDSLNSIDIPDKVTRIGAHAFYSCGSLSNVNISSTSQLKEIGSSAFRLCYSLKSINIPKTTYVNQRAFKESPTIINYYNR